MNNENMEYGGNINISDEVISIIASRAASNIDGVYGMVNTISGGFAEFLGKKNLSKGVKINRTDKNVTVDLFIIVEYGAKIPDVAWEIQEKTKNEVESMTGLNVVTVNVNVEGVSVPKDNEKAEAEDAVDIVNDETDAVTTDAEVEKEKEENGESVGAVESSIDDDDYILD